MTWFKVRQIKRRLCESQRNRLAVTHYMRCLNRLDAQLGEIVGFLKDRGEYDNTLLLLTGDHGSYLSPWGHHERYAFYEHHIRVPFIAKMPNWAAETALPRDQKPGCASLEITRTAMRALGIEYPDYYHTLPQCSEELKDYSITETLMHPKPDDYAVSIISRDYKYVMFAKIDWNALSFQYVEGERLYRVDPRTGHVDENQILTPETSQNTRKYNELAQHFIERNLEFQRQNPTYHYRTGAMGWEPKKIGPLKRGLSSVRGLLKKAWVST